MVNLLDTLNVIEDYSLWPMALPGMVCITVFLPVILLWIDTAKCSLQAPGETVISFTPWD